MTNSRDKGARGERELANKLSEYGYKCRRGQQFSGVEGEDVLGLPNIHIECKFVERLNIWDAVEQSKRDAKEGQIWTVMHRKSRKPWLVTLSLDDFMMMYRAWEKE